MSGTASPRMRVTKSMPGGPGAAQGLAVVMEACAYDEGDAAASSGDWVQVRVAALRRRAVAHGRLCNLPRREQGLLGTLPPCGARREVRFCAQGGPSARRRSAEPCTAAVAMFQASRLAFIKPETQKPFVVRGPKACGMSALSTPPRRR